MAAGRGAATDPRVERTRAAVVEATAALLASGGMGASTIEAIAQRSGVARSTIYRNWPDRSELFVEAFDELCAFSDIADRGSIEAELRALGRELVSGLTAQPWGVALPSLMAAATHDRDIAAALELFSRRRRAVVAPIFERAIARGELSASADAGSLAEAYAAGFFFRHLVGAGPLDDAFIERQIRFVLAAAAS